MAQAKNPTIINPNSNQTRQKNKNSSKQTKKNGELIKAEISQ